MTLRRISEVGLGSLLSHPPGLLLKLSRTQNGQLFKLAVTCLLLLIKSCFLFSFLVPCKCNALLNFYIQMHIEISLPFPQKKKKKKEEISLP